MSRPFVFLDRDGTLIEDRDYAWRPEDCVLLPGVGEALGRLQEAGLGLVVVTNQSGIARGYFDEAALARFHARLQALLAGHGVTLDALYHCPHLPDAGCACRKPALGMIEQACAEHAIDLPSSWVIGDKRSDADLGVRAGCAAIWLRAAPEADASEADAPEAVTFARDLSEATAHVLAQLSSSDTRPRGSRRP